MPQITTMLGFKDTRKMATKVLDAQWRINNCTQIFVKKMVQPYVADMSYVSKLNNNRVAKGIYVLDGRLFASCKLKALHINSLLESLISLPDISYKFEARFLNQFTYTKITQTLNTKTKSLIKELFKKKNMYCFLKLFYENYYQKLIYHYSLILRLFLLG